MPSLLMIGCGNMGGAMLRRWLDTGALAAADVTVVERAAGQVPPEVRVVEAPPADAAADIVLLAVKPQMLGAVAPAFAGVRVPLLLSILAGVEEATLVGRFEAAAVVRAMPNLPVAIGQGVVALSSVSADAATREVVARLMAPLGLVEWVDEALLDAVTALAGSGPAFVYRVIDALAAGGAALGLPGEQAARMALATVAGAGLNASAADATPAALAERVASPGGTTRAGLDVLDKGDALQVLLARTLAAAARRGAAMAAEARGDRR